MTGHRAARRQRKKAAIRSFHAGGSVEHPGMRPATLATHIAQMAAIDAAGGPEVFAPEPVIPPGFERIAEIAQGFETLDIPFDVGDILRVLSSGAPTAGGGGGTSFSVSDIGPIRAAIERAQLALATRQQELDEEFRQLQFAATSANADQQAAIQQQLANNDSQRTMLQQLKQQMDSQLTIRGQDISLFGIQVTERGQDIAAEQQQFQSEIDLLQVRLQNQLAEGQLKLAQETQNQIVQLQEQQLALTGRGQDIDQRGQDIQAQIAANNQALQDAISQRQFAIDSGNLALQTDAERRIRAAQETQNILDQHQAALSSAEFEQTGQQGAGNIFANIARDRGNIELQRDQFISQLLANPRDAPQAQIALGGGVNFFDQLLGGQTPGGQGIGQIGTTPLLGDLFFKTLQQINSRPDIPFFDEAAEFARQLGTAEAPPAPTLEQIQAPIQALPPVAVPPQAPPPFTPAPIQAPTIAPPAPTPIAPVTVAPPAPVTGTPDPFITNQQSIVQDLLERSLAGATAAGDVQAIARIQQQMAEAAAAAQAAAEQAAIPQAPTLPAQVTSPLAAAGGADFVTDEPLFMVNARGQVKATLGEPTAQFPGGAPEKVEITPFAHGGTVEARTAFNQMTREQQVAHAQTRRVGQRPRLPAPPVTTPPPSPTNIADRIRQLPPRIRDMPARIGPVVPRPPNVSTGPVGDPNAPLMPIPPGSLENLIRQLPPQIRDISARPFITPQDQLRPVPTEGFSPIGTPVRLPGSPSLTSPVFAQTPPQAAIQPQPGFFANETLGSIGQPPQAATQSVSPQVQMTRDFLLRGIQQSGGDQTPQGRDLLAQLAQLDESVRPRTPGEILLGIRNKLTPRFFGRVALPSQLDFLGGQVSALGIDPNDFFKDLVRGFPTGPNPGAISRASFSQGGRVYTMSA